ncbi:MAG: phytoene/squalene synthase family protein [Pseudomonadota bacterium]
MNGRFKHHTDSGAFAVLRRHGRSFAFASALLPRRQRAHSARLYRFCRYVDDLADRATDRSRADRQLSAMSFDVSSGRSEEPAIADFLDLCEEASVERSAAVELIAGVRSDLTRVRIQDERHLLEYCYQVAGTVGLMMSSILGASGPDAKAAAIDLGIAMQLTNIARDIVEDAQIDRRYLPQSIVGELEPAQIVNPTEHSRALLRGATLWLLERAEHFYGTGSRGLIYLPFRARAAILIAARLYRAIGKRIAAQGYDPSRGRAVVADAEKLRLALTSLPALLRSNGRYGWPGFKPSQPH